MTQITFSDKSNEEIIQSMCKMAINSDIQIAARQEWEKREIVREGKMLIMTEDLVASTDKMLSISRILLVVSILACLASLVAIIVSIASK